MIKIGDYVRLLQPPPQVAATPEAEDEMKTKALFQQCLSQVFRVRGIGSNNPYGETDHVELWVHDGKDSDSAAYDTIWVEQEYVAVVPPPAAADGAAHAE